MDLLSGRCGNNFVSSLLKISQFLYLIPLNSQFCRWRTYTQRAQERSCAMVLVSVDATCCASVFPRLFIYLQKQIPKYDRKMKCLESFSYQPNFIS